MYEGKVLMDKTEGEDQVADSRIKDSGALRWKAQESRPPEHHAHESKTKGEKPKRKREKRTSKKKQKEENDQQKNTPQQ